MTSLDRFFNYKNWQDKNNVVCCGSDLDFPMNFKADVF